MKWTPELGLFHFQSYPQGPHKLIPNVLTNLILSILKKRETEKESVCGVCVCVFVCNILVRFLSNLRDEKNLLILNCGLLQVIN